MAVIDITKENFKEQVRESKKPVLLDFYANWCGPCRMVAPIVEQISEERPDYAVGRVNVDEQEELARAFEITSIPALIVVKDGIITAAKIGAAPKSEILSIL